MFFVTVSDKIYLYQAASSSSPVKFCNQTQFDTISFTQLYVTQPFKCYIHTYIYLPTVEFIK